ncbi:MAG TPA: PP2C family protein-serine/threonine phosphatase [Pseudonocardia sp.]|nr:PP2C family protein-serine/threonine phosphatase [Pseudonocardia sp.]
MGVAEEPRMARRSLLERIEAAPPTDVIAVIDAELAATVGARDVSFLIADYQGRAVVRFDRSTWSVADGRDPVIEHSETIALHGSQYEQVMRTQRPDIRRFDAGVQLIAPVTVNGDALGALEMRLPSTPDERALLAVEAVAHALGYILVVNRRYTDLFERGQRTTPLSLAAEIQRRLLPSAFTHAAREFTVSGWLEPAATVGGDTFDYALDHGMLHVSITDAVGNDVHAALLATVLVGSLRNGRRMGLDLADQTSQANDALAEHSPVGEFVTGQVLRVDLGTGATTLVNAGHLFPLLLRGGQVRELQLEIDLPFGLYPGRPFRLQRLQLEPGDRLLLVTDGVLDRNSAHHDVPAALAGSAGLHARELVHQLGDLVLGATGGKLRDDATVLCLDWRGPDGRARPGARD